MFAVEMERSTVTDSHEQDFDTDLEESISEIPIGERKFRLSFDDQLAAHRSNQSENCFVEKNLVEEKRIDSKLEKINSKFSARREIYAESCRVLDVPIDSKVFDQIEKDEIVLYDFSLSFNGFRSIVNAIQSNLEVLILQSVGLTSRSLKLLSQSIDQCFYLNLLDVSGNQIGRIGLEFLVKSIEDLSSLQFLSLSNCSIGEDSSFVLGRLVQHKSLRELNLSGNKIEENSSIAIGNSLKTNKTLRNLNLSWNQIRLRASVALFRGLEKNRSLIDLELSWNGLSHYGSVALCRLLSLNKTLRRLNVSNCHIDWLGAKLISDGLRKNSIIEQVLIAFNPLTAEGIDFLVEAVSSNRSSVSFLDISGTLISPSAARLAETIKDKREFSLKYDGELRSEHFLSQRNANSNDPMKKLVQHIHQRRLRPLDYFRILDKQNRFQLDKETMKNNFRKTGLTLNFIETQQMEKQINRSFFGPMRFQHFNRLIKDHRSLHREIIIEENRNRQKIQEKNRRILETVVEHFPDIELLTKSEKHRDKIEALAKPRSSSVPSFSFKSSNRNGI